MWFTARDLEINVVYRTGLDFKTFTARVWILRHLPHGTWKIRIFTARDLENKDIYRTGLEIGKLPHGSGN